MNDDLISRSALIQRIVAERDTVVTDNHHDIGYHNGLNMAHGMAISAPAVDAVEVVRCYECKHSRTYKCKADPMYNCLMCYKDDVTVRFVEDDFFCAYGERRNDG